MLEMLFVIVAVEALTEILTKSSFFYPVRKWIFKKAPTNIFFKFIHRLLDCGYCTSVWISFIMTSFFISYLRFTNIWVFDYLVMSMVIHKGSNLVHNLMDLIELNKEKFDFKEKEI